MEGTMEAQYTLLVLSTGPHVNWITAKNGVAEYFLLPLRSGVRREVGAHLPLLRRKGICKGKGGSQGKEACRTVAEHAP